MLSTINWVDKFVFGLLWNLTSATFKRMFGICEHECIAPHEPYEPGRDGITISGCLVEKDCCRARVTYWNDRGCTSPKMCRVLRYTTAIIGNQRANQLWWAIRTTVPYMWDNGDVWRLPWDFAPAYCVGAHRSSFAVCRISESLVPVDLYLVYKHWHPIQMDSYQLP